VPHINLWETCYFAKVPDGPQAYTINVLWLPKKKGAQIRKFERGQSFTQRMWAEVSSSLCGVVISVLGCRPEGLPFGVKRGNDCETKNKSQQYKSADITTNLLKVVLKSRMPVLSVLVL
jgi:hypothetical protein